MKDKESKPTPDNTCSVGVLMPPPVFDGSLTTMADLVHEGSVIVGILDHQRRKNLIIHEISMMRRPDLSAHLGSLRKLAQITQELEDFIDSIASKIDRVANINRYRGWRHISENIGPYDFQRSLSHGVKLGDVFVLVHLFGDLEAVAAFLLTLERDVWLTRISCRIYFEPPSQDWSKDNSEMLPYVTYGNLDPAMARLNALADDQEISGARANKVAKSLRLLANKARQLPPLIQIE